MLPAHGRITSAEKTPEGGTVRKPTHPTYTNVTQNQAININHLNLNRKGAVAALLN